MRIFFFAVLIGSFTHLTAFAKSDDMCKWISTYQFRLQYYQYGPYFKDDSIGKICFELAEKGIAHQSHLTQFYTDPNLAPIVGYDWSSGLEGWTDLINTISKIQSKIAGLEGFCDTGYGMWGGRKIRIVESKNVDDLNKSIEDIKILYKMLTVEIEKESDVINCN